MSHNYMTIKPQHFSGEGWPPNIEGGQFSNTEKHMPVGTHVKYTCHYGYQLVGSDVSVCLGNGSWSNPPTCARSK